MLRKDGRWLLLIALVVTMALGQVVFAQLETTSDATSPGGYIAPGETKITQIVDLADSDSTQTASVAIASVTVNNVVGSAVASDFAQIEILDKNGAQMGTVSYPGSLPVTISTTGWSIPDDGTDKLQVRVTMAPPGIVGHRTVQTRVTINHDEPSGTHWVASVDDLTPTTLNNPPTVSGGPFPVNENVSNGTAVGTVTGNDPDGDTLTYSITAGNTGGAFAINSSTGAITTAGPIDFETTPTYALTVQVNDGMNTGTATVTINVNDLNEAPTLASIGDKNVDEETALSFTVSATDPDTGDTLTYSATGLPSGAMFNTTSGAFSWTPTEAQGPGSYPVTFTVDDGHGGSDSEAITITVNEVNQAPALGSIGNKTVDERSNLNFTISATDADVPANTLTYSASGLPTGATFNPGTQTFDWTPTEAQGPGSYPVTFTVDDGNGGSNSETITITVKEVNQAPVLDYIGDKTVDEETNLSFTIVGHDDDTGQTLTYTAAGLPTGATLNSSTGAFSWTPDETQGPGTYDVTFTVTDNGSPNMSDAETITITVNEVNVAPELGTIGDKTVNEGSNLNFAISATDHDVPVNTLAYSASGPAITAGATFTGNTFDWTPTEAQGPGTYDVTFTVDDGHGGSDSETITITVNEVNQAPVLGSIGDKTVDEETNLSFSLTATDADVPANTLTYSATGLPTGASLNASTGDFSWTPSEAQGPGTYPVTFTVTDNGDPAMSDSEAITITVSEVNVAPVANDDTYGVNEGGTLDVAAAGVLGNDTDADIPVQPLTATLVSGPTHGTLNFNTDGSFTYTHDGSETPRVDSFTYKANDGVVDSNVATVTININPQDDKPVAVDDAYATDEDTLLTIPAPGVLGNDTDIDDTVPGGLTAILVTDAAHGTLALTGNGAFTYMPDANWNGADTFTYKANDGDFDSEDAATVTITVNPLNDPPVVIDHSYTTDEDTTLNVGALSGVLQGATDVESDPLSAVLVSGVTNGTLTLSADGSFSYTPDANWNGTDTFTYKANDGTDDSSAATVTITVNPVNDPPVVIDQAYSVDEDTTLTVSSPGILQGATDVESDPLTAVLQNNVTHGTLALDTDGSFTYTPNADWHGIDTFTYKANDGTNDSVVAKTVTITVNSVNDHPVVIDHAYTVDEDTTLTVSSPGILQGATDVESDPLTAVLQNNVTHGTLALNVNGSFTYTPNADFNGNDSFTFVANDGVDNSDVAKTVTIIVGAINDAPVAVDHAYSTDEDTTLTVSAADGLLKDATDVDNTVPGDLTPSVVTSVANGTLAINNDGSFSYMPNANWNGTDTFTYKANDGTDDSDVKTVTITVNAVNDAPVVVDHSYDATEDTTLNVAAPGVLDGATDVDNAVPGDLTPSVVTDVTHGTLALASNGSFTYTPNTGYYGDDTFTYKANDGSDDSNEATVTIHVAPATTTASKMFYHGSNGWNLLSVPLDVGAVDATPSVVFDELGGLLSIYQWEPCPAEGYVAPTAVSQIGGYWVYFIGDQSISVTGAVSKGEVTTTFPCAGWQMFSVPTASMPIMHNESGNPGGPDIMFSIDGTTWKNYEDARTAGWLDATAPVWRYDNAVGAYVGVGQYDILDPWTGYWLKTLVNNVQMKIDVDYWLTNPPIVPTGSTSLNLMDVTTAEQPPLPPVMPKNLAAAMDASGLIVYNEPNPIRDVHTTTFKVKSALPIEAIRVEIFNQAGQLVFKDQQLGDELAWHTDNDYGEYLANGVYLYRVSAKVSGQWVVTSVRKLAIYR